MTDIYESTVALEQLATGDERQQAIAVYGKLKM